MFHASLETLTYRSNVLVSNHNKHNKVKAACIIVVMSVDRNLSMELPFPNADQ